jgi:uncharacterized protein
MKNLLHLLAITGCLMASMFVNAAVYTPESVPNPKTLGQAYYVSNPDSILADSTVNWLNRCAGDLYDATQVELAVVAIESIGEVEAFDFAYELFQRWGIGGKGRNTGVLMLFVLDSHDIRIMTGTGIEGVLTDANCSYIVYNVMIPQFKVGAYGDGLCLGALNIYEICTDGEAPEELQNIRSVTYRGKYAEDDDEDTESLRDVAIVLTVFGLLIFFGVFLSAKKCPKCKSRKTKSTRTKILQQATYTQQGKKEVTYTCQKCGNVFTVMETISKLHDSSDSDYGGGGYSSSDSGGSWGGGSTSGGGAGGKW